MTHRLILSLGGRVGSIILIVFACSDSKPDNKYGPNPKNAGAGYPAPGVA